MTSLSPQNFFFFNCVFNDSNIYIYKVVCLCVCVCVCVLTSPPRCLDRSEPNFVCYICVTQPLQIRNI